MDLAYESCKAGAKEVTLCYRGGYLSFPKVLNSFEMFGIKFDGELPIDGLITVGSASGGARPSIIDILPSQNLFETAYVHPWVKRSHLRWFVSDFVIKRVLWFLTGTMAGCNQWYSLIKSYSLPWLKCLFRVGELPEERLGRAYVL
jgi:dimethylaniline monooxygenase (N-oxide forming)